MSIKFKKAFKATSKYFFRDLVIYLIFSGIFLLHKNFEAWLKGFTAGMSVLLISTFLRFLYEIDGD